MRKQQAMWAIEPIGEYSNGVISGKLAESNEADETKYHKGEICADGEPHDLWEVTDKQVKIFEKNRKGDDQFHFSLFSKNTETGKFELRKHDLTYTQRNASLFPRRHRKLRGSLKTGEEKKARVPRRRGQAGLSDPTK